MLGTAHQLKSDIAVFEWQSRARIKWMFTIEKARAKMGGPTLSLTPLPNHGLKSHNHCATVLVRGGHELDTWILGYAL
jgi:hypothetical protein